MRCIGRLEKIPATENYTTVLHCPVGDIVFKIMFFKAKVKLLDSQIKMWRFSEIQKKILICRYFSF